MHYLLAMIQFSSWKQTDHILKHNMLFISQVLSKLCEYQTRRPRQTYDHPNLKPPFGPFNYLFFLIKIVCQWVLGVFFFLSFFLFNFSLNYNHTFWMDLSIGMFEDWIFSKWHFSLDSIVSQVSLTSSIFTYG